MITFTQYIYWIVQKFFAAEGFGRSDCVVILYLQRASDAKRSYGSLLFSETIYRGLSLKSFLGYDETFIEETLRYMYSKYKDIDPNDISYLEMDANGVKVMTFASVS